MVAQVGETAGRVRETLSRAKEPVHVTELPKMLKVQTSIVYMALGWLAREDKVAFSLQGKKAMVTIRS